MNTAIERTREADECRTVAHHFLCKEYDDVTCEYELKASVSS